MPANQLVDQRLHFAGAHRVEIAPTHLQWQLIERFQVFDRAGPIGTTPFVEGDTLPRLPDEAILDFIERHGLARFERPILDHPWNGALQPALQIPWAIQPQLPRADASQLGLNMTLEVTEAHAQRAGRLLPGEEQPRNHGIPETPRFDFDPGRSAPTLPLPCLAGCSHVDPPLADGCAAISDERRPQAPRRKRPDRLPRHRHDDSPARAEPKWRCSAWPRPIRAFASLTTVETSQRPITGIR